MLLIANLFGIVVSKLCLVQTRSLLVNTILGLFGIGLLATIWAIFYRISWEFQIILWVISLLALVYNYEAVKDLTKAVSKQFVDFHVWTKIGFGIITILILMQCASAPYVIDNESYYIQTIKWLNTFGLVKGLGNLHFFLGQQSAWHIIQSSLNLEFMYSRFNDLSGFLLWIANFWAFNQYTTFKKSKSSAHWLAAAFILGNLFFFQFISAPSPDIPVYIISFLVLFIFIKVYNRISKKDFKIMCLLVLFAVYIKPTCIALSLFPIWLYVKQFGKLKSLTFYIVASVAAVFTLFVLKNYIVTGYPLFPSLAFSFLEPDWQIPQVMSLTFYEMVKVYGYFLSIEQFEVLTAWSLFKIWLTLPKLHGFFNVVAVILVIGFPILLLYKKRFSKLWVVYIIFCVQMILLFYTSPQYRFFFNLLFILSVVSIGLVANYNLKVIKLGLFLGVFLPSIPLLVPLDIQHLSSYKFSQNLSSFSSSYWLYPHPNSKYETKAELKFLRSLKYYSPSTIDFFWGTGDAPLPAVRTEQLNYFQEWFHYIPQQRSNHLKDGFYSEPYYP